MGREARRVPLDFDHPLHEVWPGYLMPDDLSQPRCGDCDGTGQTPAGRWVSDLAAAAVLLADDLTYQQRGLPLHPYIARMSNHSYGTRPSPDIREFVGGLTGEHHPGPLGAPDAGYRAARKLIEAAGLPESWGLCPACDGEGAVEAYPGQQAAADAWEPTDPPVGDGWQIWETTSEGSPITPVFRSAEALADHCADTGVSMFGEYTADRDKWLGIINGTDIAAVQIAPGGVIM